MNIKISKGVIFSDNNQALSSQEADSIARANGFVYAEQFVKKHEGLSLALDGDLKISKYIKSRGLKIFMFTVANTHSDIKEHFKRNFCKGCIFRYSSLTESVNCLEQISIRLVENKPDKLLKANIECDKYESEEK